MVELDEIMEIRRRGEDALRLMMSSLRKTRTCPNLMASATRPMANCITRRRGSAKNRAKEGCWYNPQISPTIKHLHIVPYGRVMEGYQERDAKLRQ